MRISRTAATKATHLCYLPMLLIILLYCCIRPGVEGSLCEAIPFSILCRSIIRHLMVAWSAVRSYPLSKSQKCSFQLPSTVATESQTVQPAALWRSLAQGKHRWNRPPTANSEHAVRLSCQYLATPVLKQTKDRPSPPNLSLSSISAHTPIPCHTERGWAGRPCWPLGK